MALEIYPVAYTGGTIRFDIHGRDAQVLDIREHGLSQDITTDQTLKPLEQDRAC
jgi:hypothetical protein